MLGDFLPRSLGAASAALSAHFGAARSNMATLQTFRIELHNLDGLGEKRCRVYDMRPVPTEYGHDYWAAVTDVACPECEDGVIRWSEAGYVPGYRICDGCGRHFLAKGQCSAPTLVRVGTRRG